MYDGLSEFYDLFMQDVDYKAWCDFASEFIKDNASGMDVGCGSGAFTFELKNKGYSVFGVDISPQMINIATKNAKKHGYDINFAVANAEKLKLNQPVDFITAICDVVNYIKNPIDFFQNAYANLNENGVFIFDISSEYKLKNILGENVFTEEVDGVVYVWSNFLFKNKVDMFLTFFREDEDGRYTRFDEEQTQYIHSCESILSMLEKAGFTDIETYSSTDKKRVSKTSERIYFVAKKGKN